MNLKRIISAMGLITLLALLAVGASCAGDGEGNGGNGDNGEVADVTSMMEKVSKDTTEFIFIDVKALRGDDDLAGLLQDLEDSLEGLLEVMGTDLGNINALASAEDVSLFDGGFDFDDIRDELNSQGFDEDEYEGVEVWESPYGGWVALVENLIIMGHQDGVKDCVDVVGGTEGSLGDTRDAEDIMDRLPSGISAGFYIGDTIAVVDSEYQYLEASGWSFTKIDEDTLVMTTVLRFDNEDAAEDAIAEVEEDFEEKEFKHLDFDQDEEFVKLTAEIDIDDFRQL